jgi:hypothetical protein
VARAVVNSEFVTATGAVRLTGPETSLRDSRKPIARISSDSEIQLMACVPDPNLGHRPSRASGSSLASRPPAGVRTRPLRRFTTRMPACAAGPVAASQSRTRRARKAVPAGADSSTTRPPVSPYQPMAEAQSSVAGGEPSLANAPASARVPSTRLALISVLYRAVQRRLATPAPARWTQAPRPCRVSDFGPSPASADSGSQRTSSADRGGRRTSLTTWWPPERRSATSALPMSPDEPVTATFIRRVRVTAPARSRRPLLPAWS